MKQKFFIYFMLLSFCTPQILWAAGREARNLAVVKKEQARIDAQAEEIPIYDSKPTRSYKMLAVIRAEDILTKKRNAVYHQLRLQALKLGADAITEVECKTVASYLAQSCMGYAIKWD